MKKKLVQKVLAVALTFGMVMGMAGCGNEAAGTDSTSQGQSSQESSAAPSSGSESTGASEPAPAESTPAEQTPEANLEPLSITAYLPAFNVDHSEPDELYDRLIKEVNEYTNMDVSYKWAMGDVYYNDENLGLKLSTGNIEDIIITGKTDAFIQAAEQGLFWDLAPYLKDYDNLATIPEATLANAAYNGKIYGIPRSRTLARHGFGYRVDWLNNLGLAEPTTWDAFKDMLYQFTYGDPDGDGQDNTVGLFVDDWSGVWNIMLTWFGVPNEWGIDANGDLIYKIMTDEYKAGLAEIRDLYSQGVINNGANGIPNFPDVGAGQARKEGLNAGLGGCGVQTLDDMRKVETYFETEQGVDPQNPVFMLEGYVDTGKGPLCYPTTGMNNMIAISTKTVKTEEQLRQVLQFLNDLNDGACMDLIEKGWEGVTYGFDEDGYYLRYTNEEFEANGMSVQYNDGFNQFIAYYTADENKSTLPTAPASTAVTIKEQELYEKDLEYVVTNYGAAYVSDYYMEHGADLDKIWGDAQKSYILGEIDDAALEEAIKSWWSAGGETVTKEMNDAYHAAGN